MTSLSTARRLWWLRQSQDLPAQSFGGAHRGRMCVCAFLRECTCVFVSVCVLRCTVFLKKRFVIRRTDPKICHCEFSISMHNLDGAYHMVRDNSSKTHGCLACITPHVTTREEAIKHFYKVSLIIAVWFSSFSSFPRFSFFVNFIFPSFFFIFKIYLL